MKGRLIPLVQIVLRLFHKKKRPDYSIRWDIVPYDFCSYRRRDYSLKSKLPATGKSTIIHPVKDVDAV